MEKDNTMQHEHEIEDEQEDCSPEEPIDEGWEKQKELLRIMKQLQLDGLVPGGYVDYGVVDTHRSAEPTDDLDGLRMFDNKRIGIRWDR
jgi:hypothetical protein